MTYEELIQENARLRDILMTMPDAAAFMWTLDGIDPKGRVRIWMQRRKDALEGTISNAEIVDRFNRDVRKAAKR